MGAGNALRNAAQTAINQLGNSVTITTQTEVEGDRGEIAYTDNVATNLTAATSQNRLPSYIRNQLGNVESGDLNIYVKYTDTILKNDKVTFNSVDYRIKSLKPIYIEDILVVTVGVWFKDNPA